MISRPVAVDTALADLWGASAKADLALAQGYSSAHWAVGDKPVYTGRRRGWPTSGPDAADRLAAKVAAGELKPWDVKAAEGTLATIAAAKARLAALRVAAEPLEAEYDRDRWARFFLVTNSNGHIHSSMHCSTCEPTTVFAWLPDQSGLTEADAVAAHGPRLCSVCFPSAPVEWTLGLPKADKCAGSGARVEAFNPKAWKRYGACPVCGKSFALGQGGAVRAHKPVVV